MAIQPLSEELTGYVEEVALFLEESGFPKIAGRIVGLLMVCEPPHCTAQQLGAHLGASKASISSMTRWLQMAGLIEKVALPGERSSYFALTEDGFERTFNQKITTVAAFRALADKGLKLLEADGLERTKRLRTLKALYAFWEHEMPLLLEKWRAQRDELIAGEEDD